MCHCSTRRRFTTPNNFPPRRTVLREIRRVSSRTRQRRTDSSVERVSTIHTAGNGGWSRTMVHRRHSRQWHTWTPATSCATVRHGAIHHTEQLPTVPNSVFRYPTRSLASSLTPSGLLGGASFDDSHCWEWWWVLGNGSSLPFPAVAHGASLRPSPCIPTWLLSLISHRCVPR